MATVYKVSCVCTLHFSNASRPRDKCISTFLLHVFNSLNFELTLVQPSPPVANFFPSPPCRKSRRDRSTCLHYITRFETILFRTNEWKQKKKMYQSSTKGFDEGEHRGIIWNNLIGFARDVRRTETLIRRVRGALLTDSEGSRSWRKGRDKRKYDWQGKRETRGKERGSLVSFLKLSLHDIFIFGYLRYKRMETKTRSPKVHAKFLKGNFKEARHISRRDGH